MPHRRTVKKGSFSGHFDHLVEHFGDTGRPKGTPRGEAAKLKPHRKRSVHQQLFDASHH
jgi:hypothetical protein